MADLGINSPFSIHYFPSDYGSIYRALRNLKISPANLLTLGPVWDA